MSDFVPPDLPITKLHIIPPAIDPLSPKNMPLAVDTARQVVQLDRHGRKSRNGSFQASGPGVSLVRNTAYPSLRWTSFAIHFYDRSTFRQLKEESAKASCFWRVTSAGS